jgi:hypothetical protein
LGVELEIGSWKLGVGKELAVDEEDTMARTSWFDEKADLPLVQQQVNKLKSFTDALADGIVERRSSTRRNNGWSL